MDDVQRKAVLGTQVPASYLSELSSPKRGRDPSYRDTYLFFLNFCATQASEFYTIKMNFLLHSQSMQILEVEVSLYMLSTGQASSICLSPKAWKFSVELSPPSWVTSKEREHGTWHESVQRSDLGMGPIRLIHLPAKAFGRWVLRCSQEAGNHGSRHDGQLSKVELHV